MKKDEIFFAKEGHTLTSVCNLANQAKESYQADEASFNDIRFYNEELGLIGSDARTPSKYGVKSIDDFEEKMMRIASLKAFQAWVGEARQAKERMLQEVERLSHSDFGIDVPERPKSPEYLTKDDVLGTWDIKKRARYYALEATAATFGGFIHPTGEVASARKELLKVINNPNIEQGDGRDTKMRFRTPSVPLEKVEEMFMSLQKKHRSIQAEFNSLKFEIERATVTDRLKKNSENSEAMARYDSEMAVANAKLREAKDRKAAEIQELKVVIPDCFKAIVERLK